MTLWAIHMIWSIEEAIALCRKGIEIMNIKDFKVGQKVYIELMGNIGRRSSGRIEEWEITSVGRKYIKAGKPYNGQVWGDITFEFDEDRGIFVEKTNCSIDYFLYATRQKIEDKIERERLYDEIRRTFNNYIPTSNMTLECLRKIKNILNEYESEV